MSNPKPPAHNPDDPAHFADCIDCHRVKYATPGMTAGEFAPYLPAHLQQEYWRTKLDEYFTAQDRAAGADPDTGQASR